MKTTFKRVKPRNKLGVSTYSCYVCKSTNYNYNNYFKLIVKTIIFPTLSGKTNIICYICNKKKHKVFQCQNKRRKYFCQNIKTYSKGQMYFFALGYDIIADKSNLLVDCGAAEYVINDWSKFWTRESFCQISRQELSK